jgi:Ca2+-binding RTX toxin-like protein
MTVRTVVLAALAVAAVTAAYAYTASVNVPATHVGRQQFTIDANALKPAACSALNLTSVVAGVTGTTGNDLILGPSTGSTLNGNGGQDCIVGGGGNDTLRGNGNHAGDVCIGGPGTDTFNQCQTAIQ